MKIPRRRRTWRQKIGKRLWKHVEDTTTYNTQREVKANIAARTAPFFCADCAAIASKLGWKL